MTRIVFSLVLALLFPLASCAETPQPSYEAGTHYQPLRTPVRTRDPSKIEVVEVFWYGCGHCYTFEPMVNKWAQNQPADVDFRASPAMWNNTMRLHAQMHFTAKALGLIDQMKPAFFTALNVERKRLDDVDEIADFFGKYDVSEDKFLKVFNSFGVKSQVSQADARARGYGITGTPEMVVNGKYRVSTRMTGGQAQMLKVVDYLVEQERASR